MKPEKREMFFEPSEWDLSDRKSVRTTFGLRENIICLLKEMAEEHEITYKELFDNVFQKLLSEHYKVYSGQKKHSILDSVMTWVRIVVESEERDENIEKIVRKTFVVSKGTLKAINTIANFYNFPRDIMVGAVINWLYSYYDERADEIKEEKKIEEAYQLILSFHSQMLIVAKNLNETLGTDAISERFNYIEEEMSNLLKDIQFYFREGEEIPTGSERNSKK